MGVLYRFFRLFIFSTIIVFVILKVVMFTLYTVTGKVYKLFDNVFEHCTNVLLEHI